MAKRQRKKRSKQYTGQDAAIKTSRIVRVTVPDRSTFGQWWHENKKVVRTRGIFFAVVFAILWLFSLLFSWLF